MSYIGTNKVGKMYLGSTAIGKAYLGNDLVYDSAEGGVTPVLPYDAEVEYLQTSGTQYIDTGIVQTTRNFELTVVLQWTGSTANDFEAFFGYLGSGSNSTPRFQLFKYQGKWACGTNSTIATDVSVDGYKHTFFVTGNSSTNQESLYIDGSLKVTGTTASTGISSSSPSHYIGGRDDYGTTFSRPCSAKFYSLNYKKFTDAAHTTLIQEWDFIPVRVGTTGYMYDKISGTLFGNGGSGSFTLGNDKS